MYLTIKMEFSNKVQILLALLYYRFYYSSFIFMKKIQKDTQCLIESYLKNMLGSEADDVQVPCSLT